MKYAFHIIEKTSTQCKYSIVSLFVSVKFYFPNPFVHFLFSVFLNQYCDIMKNRYTHIVGTVPKYNSKIIE